MERNYYFLGPALPELKIGHPPDITFTDLEFLLETNLSAEDFAKTVVIRRYYDIQNIRSFWKKEELDPRGYYDENQLEDALLTESGFPGYVYDFKRKYESKEERLHNFSALIEAYYQNEISRSDGFLKKYLTFEREWRLVLTGFRAKILGRNIAQELQFEDADDELTGQILAQKDAKTYEPPSSYSELKALFEEHKKDPLELHKALCEYRFRKIESMYGIDIFSIGRILAYLTRLIIVEKWQDLDKKKGLQVIEEIVRGAS